VDFCVHLGLSQPIGFIGDICSVGHKTYLSAGVEGPDYPAGYPAVAAAAIEIYC
jgi:hypothetical protein